MTSSERKLARADMSGSTPSMGSTNFTLTVDGRLGAVDPLADLERRRRGSACPDKHRARSRRAAGLDEVEARLGDVGLDDHRVGNRRSRRCVFDCGPTSSPTCDRLGDDRAVDGGGDGVILQADAQRVDLGLGRRALRPRAAFTACSGDLALAARGRRPRPLPIAPFSTRARSRSSCCRKSARLAPGRFRPGPGRRSARAPAAAIELCWSVASSNDETSPAFTTLPSLTRTLATRPGSFAPTFEIICGTTYPVEVTVTAPARAKPSRSR